MSTEPSTLPFEYQIRADALLKEGKETPADVEVRDRQLEDYLAKLQAQVNGLGGGAPHVAIASLTSPVTGPITSGPVQLTPVYNPDTPWDASLLLGAFVPPVDYAYVVSFTALWVPTATAAVLGDKLSLAAGAVPSVAISQGVAVDTILLPTGLAIDTIGSIESGGSATGLAFGGTGQDLAAASTNDWQLVEAYLNLAWWPITVITG